jgi:hypothetical protein
MARTNLSDSLPNLPRGAAKRIANNTFRYQEGEDVVTRLHFTDIIRKHADGSYTLSSGGWKSKTTKERLNDYSPYRVFSNKGVWYVGDSSKAVPFSDGIRLPQAFEDAPRLEKDAEKARALKARIKLVVSRALKNGKPCPLPESGDCFYCQFERAHYEKGKLSFNSVVQATPLDNGHIAEHIREGYICGSLIYNALLDSGLAPLGARFWMTDNRMEWSLVRRKLVRFLSRRMGLIF